LVIFDFRLPIEDGLSSSKSAIGNRKIDNALGC